MKVTAILMAKLVNLGKRVIVRPPGSQDRPEYLPGIVVDYNPTNEKATIICFLPTGMQTTLQSVPHDSEMELQVASAGCWCSPEEVELDEKLAEPVSDAQLDKSGVES